MGQGSTTQSSRGIALISINNMTIFRKNSTNTDKKVPMEVKVRIEEGDNLERKVSKKILELKHSLSYSTSEETKELNILHENRQFEPVDISINLCDLALKVQ